jgi:twitching motility protein PilU
MSRSLFQDLLDYMVKAEASDLYLNSGMAPSARIHGKVTLSPFEEINHSNFEFMLEQIITPEQKATFDREMELNLTLISDQGQRFRTNLYRQQQYPGAVIRRIKTDIPIAADLGLPSYYTDVVMEKRGLVLVAGPTGAGKSSSLASMLNHRNLHGSGHIVIIEDPIEYVHENKGCVFMQREVGIDTVSYPAALKNALRQSPDIVVIGEIRDRQTMENALHFSETGHLVLATIHANNSVLALEHVINFFPEEMHRQVISSLALNVRAIFCQRLVENVKKQRTLIAEIMKNVGLIRHYIEENKIKEIKDVIEKSRDQGMQSFDQALLDLLMKGDITNEVAMRESDNPGNLKLRHTQAIARSQGMDKLLSDKVDSSHSTAIGSTGRDPSAFLDEPEFDSQMN